LHFVGKLFSWFSVDKLSNGHSPQICVTRSLLEQMCQGESHFFQKWPLASVGESGEYEQNRLANVDKFGESEQNRLANGSKSGKSEQTRLANVNKFSESDPFPKIDLFVEYSNSPNSLKPPNSPNFSHLDICAT
jgi:hypothetical protein